MRERDIQHIWKGHEKIILASHGISRQPLHTEPSKHQVKCHEECHDETFIWTLCIQVNLWDASQCICFSEIIMLWEATIHKLSNWAASPCCPMRKSSHSQSMYDRWARACGKGSWTGFLNRRCQRGLQSNANTRCPRGLTSQKWSNMAPKCEPTVPPRLWHPAKRANLVFSNAQFSSSVPSWCPFYHGLHGKHSFSTCLEPLPAECRRGSIVASMPGGHKAARST